MEIFESAINSYLEIPAGQAASVTMEIGSFLFVFLFWTSGDAGLRYNYNTDAVSLQAMACATAESVTAGMNGLGMPVRSGLGDWRASEGSTGTAKGALISTTDD